MTFDFCLFIVWELPTADYLEVQNVQGYQEYHIEKNEHLNKNSYKTEISGLDDDHLNPVSGFMLYLCPEEDEGSPFMEILRKEDKETRLMKSRGGR